MKPYQKIIIVFSMLFVLTSLCEARKEHQIAGRTMGTTYHVKVVAGDREDLSGLKEKIERRLAALNRVFSTYIPDSEISRFNELQRAGQKFKVSDDFMQVMRVGRNIHRLTEGAWDGTVNPLVDLWSFGPTRREARRPAAGAIEALLPAIGFELIRIVEPNFLEKKQAAVTLDLNAIAKGYAVDQVAKLTAAAGYQNYLVEIGGEIYAAGLRPDGHRWRVGINRPQKEAAFNEVYRVVSIFNQAFATSGDYRNFFEMDGVRYSHVMDPRSGYPVSNGVVSVSVIADSCTLADGLATAIMVMGAAEGIRLVEQISGVEAFVVVEDSGGSLLNVSSQGFRTERPPE